MMAIEKFDFKLVLKNQDLSAVQIAKIIHTFWNGRSRHLPTAEALEQARVLKNGGSLDAPWAEYSKLSQTSTFSDDDFEITYSEREKDDPYQQRFDEREDYMNRLKAHLEKLDYNDPSFAILSETLSKINFGFFNTSAFA